MLAPGVIGTSKSCSFRLAADEIHIWNADQLPVRGLAEFLSADEVERASRIAMAEPRQSFLGARACLRYLLGRYTESDPGRLRFSYGPHGKPSLPGSGLEFSLTRSAGPVRIAVAAGRPLGIDVERIRPIGQMAQIARRFFTPGEAAALEDVPAEHRLEAFFRCWARKEAYLKATGAGLTGLASGPCGTGWDFVDLAAPCGYVAALAYACGAGPIRLCEYSLQLT